MEWPEGRASRGLMRRRRRPPLMHAGRPRFQQFFSQLEQMKRARFVPPRALATPPGAEPAVQAGAHVPTAAAAPTTAFNCLLQPARKKAGGAVDGTLVLQGTRAQVLDLQLRGRASGRLPEPVAAALHAAHAAAVAQLAAGQPLGTLWQADVEQPEELVVDAYRVQIEDDRSAAVTAEEWALRQRVADEARGGKPKDAVGAAIPPDSLGE